MKPLEMMLSIDQRYRAASNLTERRFYSIFYSGIFPCKWMVIGFNPGGDPDTWHESALASRSFYENDEHEYVDCHYPLAVAMRAFLIDVLNLGSVNAVRHIPKTNLIFRRSRGQDYLGIRKSDAIHEARPFLEEIIKAVSPEAIFFEGMTTLNEFERAYCASTRRNIDGRVIETPNGRNSACVYRYDIARVVCLGKSIKLIGLGHPSKYAKRIEWPTVVSCAKAALA